jgi:hypothetical protein
VSVRVDIVALGVEAGTREFKQVATEGLKPQTVWFDARMARLQAEGTQMLVTTSSDVDPASTCCWTRRR